MKGGWLFVGLLACLFACENPSLLEKEGPVPCKSSPRKDEACLVGGNFVIGSHAKLTTLRPACEGGTEVCGVGNPPTDDYYPSVAIALDPFFLDVFPATNQEYLECFASGFCKDECQKNGNCAGRFYNEYSIHDPNLADYPAATIDIEGAEQYCRWKGKRLPSEAEWERAARGFEENDFTWGDELPSCAEFDCGGGAPPFVYWSKYWHTPIGYYHKDITKEGIRDLLTGTRELLQDRYEPYAYYRILKDYKDEILKNPISKIGSEPVVRGKINPNGNYQYETIDYSKNSTLPHPAWMRDSSFFGGVRCARSDSSKETDVREDFYSKRKNLLSGKKL